jgi:hypothetical protein
MSRIPLSSVTLPILVDAVGEEQDGECIVFPSRGGLRLQKVRNVSQSALQQWLAMDTHSPLGVALRGLGKLRRAYLSHDFRALLLAVEQARPLLPKSPPGVTTTEQWSEENAWDGGRWIFSEAMSHAMKNARTLVWWPLSGSQEPLPGIYCPDMGAAVAIAVLLDMIRICPHCGKPFVARQSNIGYCTPKHGVAHRTARSREKKRRSAEAK